MNTIIHLGFPRTATTFLQTQIFAKLKDTITTRYITPYINYNAYNTHIISDERYSWYQTRHTILEQLKQNYPDAKIILGNRDIETIKHSLYSHLIGKGLPMLYSTWEKQQPTENETYISHIKQLFKQIYIYEYEDFKQDKQKIIKEICNYIGEPVPEYENKVINKRYKTDNLEIIPYLNTILYSEYNIRGLIPKETVKDFQYNKQDKTITLKIIHPFLNDNTGIQLTKPKIKTIKFKIKIPIKK